MNGIPVVTIKRGRGAYFTFILNPLGVILCVAGGSAGYILTGVLFR